MLSMNVFQQTTKPNLLYFPSSSASCHGRRRISPHNPPLLASFPATKMKFNPKSLHLVHGIQHSSCIPLLASPPATLGFNPKSLHLMNGIQHSPATMEFNPQSLHYLPCHGIKHSFCELVLASPATMKFCSVLFALPRDNEEFPSDNEQEQSTSVSSDDANEEPLKKVSGSEIKKQKYVVRKATLKEFKAAAMLKAEVFYEDPSQDRTLYKIRELAKKEYNEMLKLYNMRASAPRFMCLIAVRKEVCNGSFKKVIGTLDFCVDTDFKYLGIISNVTVAKSGLQQDVASSMLNFVIEYAKENGISQIKAYVRRDNKQALTLYIKMGFTILAEKSATPLLEENDCYTCSLNL